MMEASIDSKPDQFTKRLIAAVGLSWLVLALWSRSRYAPYLNHEILEGLPLTVSVEYVALLLVFVAGWVLMIVAMMLPGILPLVTRVRREAEGARPAVLVMAGYVGVWTIFGGLAHAGDVFVHEATHRFGWLGANEWLLSAGLLALAGAYQLTPFKRACLRAHRATGGPGQKRHAAQVGLWHGLSCTGCCGPLMLLMFGVACGNVPVMLLLGTIMVVEKQAPWGRRITVPLGLVLLGLSLIAGLSGSGVL